MNCLIVRDRLSPYMDGELAPALTAEVEQHLAKCASCAQVLDTFQQIDRLARWQDLGRTWPLPWTAVAQRLDFDRPAAVQLSAAAVADAAAQPMSIEGVAASGCQADAMAESPGRPNVAQRRRSWLGWKWPLAIAAALAASLLLIASRWLPQSGLDSQSPTQAAVTTMNLQPLLEQFGTDAELALHWLTDQFSTHSVAENVPASNLVSATYVKSAASRDALPGDAKIASTKVLSFPFCHCTAGQCHCGPDGCSGVACMCERPDGSTYLVLEHCKSQKMSFGDLPVQLVTRQGQTVEMVTVDGMHIISVDRSTGKVIVVGLRGEAEIETLLASN